VFFLLCPYLSLFHSSFALLDSSRLLRKPAGLVKEVEDRLHRREVRLPFFLRPADWWPSSRVFPGIPTPEHVRKVLPPVPYCLDGNLTVFAQEGAFANP
jgi:hypothetical protein